MTGLASVGMVLVDKPVGITSHDVVRIIRRQLSVRRVGHAGTLDPLASGLLPCLIGPATRLADWLHHWPKSYVGTLQLGVETPTGDAESAPPELIVPPDPPTALLRAAEQRFVGPLQQIPPAFSAKKLVGVRAHQLARAGATVVLPSVPISIHRLRLMRSDTPGRLYFAARVSTGTYLRALARDLGRFFGTGAHLGSLRRTSIGPLRVRGAWRLNAENPTPEPSISLIPPIQIPLALATLTLGSDEALRFAQGQKLARSGVAEGTYRVVAGTPQYLVGIGTIEEDLLRPRVVLGRPREIGAE